MSDHPIPLWNPSLSVGIAEIDKQHETLCRLLNDIQRAIEIHKDADLINDRLGQFDNYLRLHFSVEESLMRTLTFPDYEKHRESHKALLNQLTEIRNKVRTGGMPHPELLKFLGSWLNEHVMRADKGYSTHFQKAGGAGEILKGMEWMAHLWRWRDNS